MTQHTDSMQTNRTATLMLDDGTVFRGYSFGYERPVAGEVVFNTAMTGYPESLTDPSYAGQLMVLTYPLVGNYGVPPRTFEPNGIATFMESEKIHAEAIIVSDYSHEHGVMMGRIVIGDADNEIENGELKIENYEHVNYVDRVSCKEIICYLPDGTSQTCSLSEASNSRFSILNSQFLKRVVLLDCGVKHNIIRCLLRRNVAVIRVPWDYDFNQLEYDGLFISNGPGDPDTCDAAVRNIRKALSGDKPICGICMGNQLLAKAGGASIYKLKYGHRSHNQPVRMVGTEKCFITSQNHGYAVDNDTLGEEWEPLFINMNDGTNEGIKHKTKPFFSSQFHPEACSGPLDTEFMFDKFADLL